VEDGLVRINKIPRWLFPLGLAAAGIGAAGAVLLRGCWHRNLGWPVRHGDFSYQVCNDCSVVRLFDEKTFRPYGPYGYDVEELIALERTRRMKRLKEAEGKKQSKEEKVPQDFAI
jgi:hypothetical protein